ncbi:Avt2p NDAI_0I00130 [Naumovozyma dairenensis CBS 421]|uniref:Amino acid transporter transmembrane domain-containing protein n=1 Tax=Naumovozyma dairenensis (strain ATCC 10597 / BCRC 20456 / CBS 421 / NBRC 0211 / NRRL Y-12639) TaxID=1071378 RepID=G0WFM1_NAUDC|nr:hypothetical protein NDAI_0I00130 [Naumovozyma dairenensis CBS 421]CCD26582.1 hypothetical protein NDAI_0I00130 [Naumovozyma dairenensis CBS 421]
MNYTIVPTDEEFQLQDSEALVKEIIDENNKKSNIYMAFVNMANSILGAGIITQPLAVKNAGLCASIVIYIMLGFIVDWTLRLLITNITLSSKLTYGDTVEYTMGRKGKYLILCCNGLFALGGCIGFCIIIGDTIPHVLRIFIHSHFVTRNSVIFFSTLFISYPLSLLRDISALSSTSFLALISMTVIVMTVVVFGPSLPAELKGSGIPSSSYVASPSLFRSLSIVSFALVCHHNTSFIFHSIRNKSLTKFTKLTHLSVFISVIFCMIMGYAGFFIFTGKTKGNILNNFPPNGVAINIARVCFGFNMLTTLPLELFVLRDVIAVILLENEWIPSIEEKPGMPILTRKWHFIVTTIIVFLTMSVSLLTCNLGALFELVGATTASVMAYILPPYVNLLLRQEKEPLPIKSKIPHYFCILFGFTVMIVSSFQTIVEALADNEQKHCEI